MSSVYSIDFSEPLKEGFEIPAGSFNGPGGAVSNTSLRLHGRGALEWGEAVNEDLVRLTENFASASPPQSPLTGQLWAEVAMYRQGPSAWFKYDPNATGANPKWVAFTPTVTNEPPTTEGTEGQHVYDQSAGVLWGYFAVSTVGTNVNEWRERAFTTQATDVLPSDAEAPVTTLKVYNVHHDSWAPPQAVAAAPSSEPPTNPQIGALWFNTTTGDLTVWDGAAWQAITTGTVSAGDLEMGSNQLNFTNMFLNEGNGNITVAPDIRFTQAGLITCADTLHLIVDDDNNGAGNLVIAKGAQDTTTDVPLLTVFNNGEVRSNTASYETLVVNNNSLTNKKYVDDLVAASSGTGAVSSVFSGAGPFDYDAGDIAINAGKIYIALAAGTSTVPGGNWKQVWPATYS